MKKLSYGAAAPIFEVIQDRITKGKLFKDEKIEYTSGFKAGVTPLELSMQQNLWSESRKQITLEHVDSVLNVIHGTKTRVKQVVGNQDQKNSKVLEKELVALSSGEISDYNLDYWKKEAKKRRLSGLSASEIFSRDAYFYRRFYRWSRTQDNPESVRAQIFFKKSKYTHLKTIEAWKAEAQKRGILGLRSSEVHAQETSFYMAFYRWSTTQDNPESVRAEIFCIQTEYSHLITTEAWREEAQKRGFLGSRNKAKMKGYATFYMAFYRWSTTQDNPEKIRAEVFPSPEKKYTHLDTIEAWKAEAQKRGILGLRSSEVVARDSSFYQSFYAWSRAQRDPERVRAEIISKPIESINLAKTSDEL